MGITHFDEAPNREYAEGHIRGRWTFLGEGAGSVGVGVRRIEVAPGGWSTPVHDHGREEELFYVLAGRGIAWHRSRTAEIAAGDCLHFAPRSGGHSLHALEALDVLAFGPREHDESLRLPRLGLARLGAGFADVTPGSRDRVPLQFLREGAIGPPALPDATGPRPSTIVNLADVEARPAEHGAVSRLRRDLGAATGSVKTGLQHVEVAPGRQSAPLHCHSVEEELFVILSGDGTLRLGAEEVPVGPGHVVSRPAGTGVSHAFQAGQAGLTYLAYGTRDPADVCWYPTSRKLSFRGVGVIVRVDPLDYWDGEDTGLATS